MAHTPIVDLAREAAAAFDLGALPLDIRPYGNGLINDTFLVTTADDSAGHIILQRINPRVFAEPERLMDNLRVVLAHIRQRQARAPRTRDLRFPRLYGTSEGRDFVLDADGALWRAMEFIEATRVFDTLTGTPQAAEVGFALGRFHELVRDLDPQRLHDTRPQFHNTPHYIQRLDKAFADAGERRRSPEMCECLAFIEARRAGADTLERARREGRLGVRPVHGDPKLNNFLFDRHTGTVVSLIDLDTVKPGLIHYDIGDCIRSCCNRAGETPAAGQAVTFDLGACRAVLQNYLSAGGADLPAAERGLLYDAIRLIPLELGIRFLTDYLEDDRYFKVEHPDHNLVRARTQLRLTSRIEAAEDEIRAMITELTGGR